MHASGIPSPRTCWRTVRIFVSCRFCSAMPPSAPRSAIFTSLTPPSPTLKVRSMPSKGRRKEGGQPCERRSKLRCPVGVWAWTFRRIGPDPTLPRGNLHEAVQPAPNNARSSGMSRTAVPQSSGAIWRRAGTVADMSGSRSTPVVTVTAPSVRAFKRPAGFFNAPRNYCLPATSTWSSPCRTNSTRLSFKTGRSCISSSLKPPRKRSSNWPRVGNALLPNPGLPPSFTLGPRNSGSTPTCIWWLPPEA